MSTTELPVGSRESATLARAARHRDFRPDIEGLRAVAVLAVVLFHADVPGLAGGFVGVDVFFVISGFLITGMLWREASTRGTVRLRDFYGARARRLLPASAFVGVVTLVASALLLPAGQVKPVTMDGITSALYVSNYWFIGSGVNYFAKDGLLVPSPFQHYWSLGVEEQFYLVWPLLLIGTAWILRRIRRRRPAAQAAPSVRPFAVILAVIAVVSFALALMLTFLIPPVAFFSLPTRAWQLSLGGLIALTATQWRRLPAPVAAALGWTGLALVGGACVFLGPTTPYPGYAALVPTAGAVFVIAAGCATPTRGCGRVLGLAPMGWIGRQSYSWYLWHWPVLVLVPVVLGQPVGLAVKLAAVLLSLGLAMLTLRYVENPLRFAPRVRTSARGSLGLGGGVTAVTVCVGLVILLVAPTPAGPGPGRGPAVTPMLLTATTTPAGSSLAAYDAGVGNVFAEVRRAVSDSAQIRGVPSNLTPALDDLTSQQLSMLTNGCLRVLPFDATQPECVVGDAAAPTKVAVIGDSRAAMFNPGFQRAAADRHWRLQMMAKAGCPIVDLPVSSHFNGFAEWFLQCANWRNGVLERLRAEPAQLVVISSARAYDANGAHTMVPGLEMFDAAWLRGLTELTHDLRATGAQVLILGPTVDLPMPAPSCLAAHPDDATQCVVHRGTAFDQGIRAEAAATEAGGGRYADVTELFCGAEGCPAIVGNTLVYFDAGHITREYSLQLAPALAALADRALAGA